MNILRLMAAMAFGLATATAAVAAGPVNGIPPPNHGGVHGIIIPHCHPTHSNNWCRCHPTERNNWCRPHGIIIGRPVGVSPTNHPIGVPVEGPGHAGPVNGIPVEQQHAQH